jgi:hypothetical protein
MTTRKLLLGLFVAALAALHTAPVRAEAPAGAATDATSAASEESQDWSSWIKTLDDGAKKLRELRKIEGQLQEEVDKAISRRYPRGAEKERLLAALERAKADLAEAEEQYPEQIEQARQAGVPQGLLQDYEDLAEEAPASNED